MTQNSNYNPFSERAPQQNPTWIDGLPHDFKGWGPQTLDPETSEHVQLGEPEGELKWLGHVEADRIVWQFEPKH